MLNSCAFRGANSVVDRLLEVEESRAVAFLGLYVRIPSFFPGVGAVCEFLDEVSRRTCGPIHDLSVRSRDEIQRSVEAIVGGDEQSLNDSARVLMEIEVLLHEWRLDLDRMDAWAKEKPETIHRTFGFGKVLNRVKQAEGVADDRIMPEWQEYELHSARLHPSPGASESAFPGLDWRVSELVSHVSRIVANMIKLMEVSDRRIPTSMLEELTVDPAPWNQLYADTVERRNKWVQEQFAQRGLTIAPRRPTRKGRPWVEERVIPLGSDDVLSE